MEIIVATAKEYRNVFDIPYHIFNSTAFIELNGGRYDAVHYLMFRQGKIKLGIVLAERDGELCSPVSAPFGGFSFVKSDVSVLVIEQAVEVLAQWVVGRNCTAEITLPPLFYASDFLCKVVNVFDRSLFKLQYTDLNYQIELHENTDYMDMIQYNARRNLNIAIKQPYTFYQATNDDQIEQAYQIIKANRESKGYPLKMTFENVLNTIRIIPADFFILELDGIGVAAAQIFHVAKGIVQVIYWGDAPGYAEARPMNYLSYKVVEHYVKTDVKVIDIGPSTEYGVPNYGLCEFKESIGCSVALKYKYKLAK